MDLNRFDAAIVDLDGTMVDTLDDFCVALNRMLGDLPAPFAASRVDRGAIEKLVGKGSEHLLKSVLALVYRASEATNSEVNDGPAASGEADLLERLYPPAWESYQRHYHQVNGQYARVFPGVQAGLQYLQARGLKLACLTNKPTAFAQALLQAKGLDGFFDLTFGGDAFERKKPDPLPLLATCAALGTAPQRTLMIGDSSNDAQAAHAAGCPVLLVTYGYNHGEPIREVKADAYLDSLQQLMAPDS
ncbi:MAG: phosphoglycolate phosphatase [Gammaproteobacteria bacterium]|nr:phosphoglycolate phosphatase [Rhodoferax sp.]MBU3900602.1 phosphoglycolate phosphatase [Gammaproteobacteria bacterium]MBU3996735.1 phosphoglycolate phosphatase [Gammaproteobacteria bacterium]MBU4081022.1 phosphoglycolate phosphatase [Gammaproteobacteria bacterium]MBU4112085.1 phosphoglycolate phosphatase [Gammaproteobacteria bacterium]